MGRKKKISDQQEDNMLLGRKKNRTYKEMAGYAGVSTTTAFTGTKRAESRQKDRRIWSLEMQLGLLKKGANKSKERKKA